jgi:4-amino-4-deoxy-L-arabinose transferase-like glycosyltransferase
MIKKHKKTLLIGIILLAFLLRNYGINWDQGFHLHPDERAIVLSVVDLKIPKSISEFLSAESTWNPKFFAYGSFPFYLLRIAGDMTGILLHPSFSEYGSINLVGRLLSSIFDIGSLLLLYLLGRRFFNSAVGLLAALFYALSVLPIQLSHFYAVDTILTFFSIAVIYGSINLENKRSIKAALLCGICLGLALATKISAVILLIPIGVSLLYCLINKKRGDTSDEWHKTIIKAAALCITLLLSACIIFIIVSPYALIDFANFARETQMQSAMTKDAFVFPYTLQYVFKIPYAHELKNIFLFGLGPILTITAFAGLLLLLIQTIKEKAYEKQARNLIILSFFIVYFLIVGSFKIGFMRYLLPLYPLLCLFAATFALWFYLYLAKKSSPKIIKSIFIIGGICIFIWPISFIQIYNSYNTRVQATSWVIENIPAGKAIAVEHWDDTLPLANAHQYNILTLPLYDPDTYQKWQQISSMLQVSDYLIIASNRLYVPLMQLSNCDLLPAGRCYPAAREYYENLFSGKSDFKKIAEFEARPTIPIVAIPVNDEQADESFTVYDHPKVMIFRRQ